MQVDDQKSAVARGYEAAFGAAPVQTCFAPGRVNLLGEHTDYNGGFVLPMALQDLGVAVAIGPGTPGKIELQSMTLDQRWTGGLEAEREGHWSDYILGCVKAVAHDPVARGGVRIALDTSVPLGAGLSSSAALEVACLRALTALFDLGLSPAQIAQRAQEVENNFVGMPCGIMDQFASSVGTPGQALFLNTRTLQHHMAPGFADHAFLVVASGVSHQLTDSGYKTRVEECKAACQALGVEMLSDLNVEDLARIEALPDPLNKRARHVVLDNDHARKGYDALCAADPHRFGALMHQSHATARDNYAITVPETNALVKAAEDLGALGARQTGGGWGGAIVALVPSERAEEIGAQLTQRFSGTTVLAIT